MFSMREFFGFGGYQRTPEGAYSWQHLTFVSILMMIMVASAILLGRRNRLKGEKSHNLVLAVSAIAIDSLELFKIVMGCVVSQNPMHWIQNLPLFLCSIQLITIPLAAFSRGRVKQAALDFVCIFGILGAVLGTYGAAQNYSCYPVLSFDNVVSGLTHSISGFVSLYIMVSGMECLKKKNIVLTFAILGVFCVLAYVANILIDYNYMFLMRGDGTPYDIFYNLVGGHKLLYPMIVVSLFLLYILAFYGVRMLFARKKQAVGK